MQKNKKIMPGIFIILYVFLIIISQSGYGLSDTKHLNFLNNKPAISSKPSNANNTNNNSYYKKVKQSGDESAPWSNAFNFRKSMGT
ncbi:MAG: hypothetical protein OXC48_05250, partial [Endozoicomonadaceae bacterium]|nr:hypothetical protein [Endozoicomonadaceae bacterium]